MTREEIIKSLQHAVDYMNEHEGNRITETTSSGKIIDTVIHKNTLIEAIKLLEEQKTGKWIDVRIGRYVLLHRCSNCLQNSVMKSKYCPYCGARMEIEDGNTKN